MKYVKKKLSDLKPYENNPRINDEAVDDVVESIRQCSYIAPIVIDEDGVILAGHTRYKALKKLGYKECEVVIASDLTEEQKKKYFTETALALRREGYEAEPILNGHLAVTLADIPLCEVNEVGGIAYRRDNISTAERIAAKDKVYEIVANTAEYMRLMEQAPSLKSSGLEEGYKVLADFNGTVLAAKEGRYGVQFVTWDWDFDRKGVSHGHYHMGNYGGAKQDFATRSGLAPEQTLFTDAQLIEIYRCCADTLDAGFDLTYEQEKAIHSVQEQIRHRMPDIMEHIREQDQHTAQPYSQEQTM